MKGVKVQSLRSLRREMKVRAAQSPPRASQNANALFIDLTRCTCFVPAPQDRTGDFVEAAGVSAKIPSKTASRNAP